MLVPKLTLSLFLVAALAGALSPLATAAPPANTARPTITGTATEGQTLTAENGSWTNAPTAFQYQWQRCRADGAGCGAILGATQQTYVVRRADVRRTLRVRVRAVNSDGATDARSDPTAVVTAAGAAPQNTVRPTISGAGDPQVGEELTAQDGSWSGSPTSFAYQWQRCDLDATSCFSVAGATGKTYGVRSIDLGFRLRVTVRAANANGSATAASLPTGVVAPRVEITNNRPTVRILSTRFLGRRIYVRFRICDDDGRNLAVLATDSRPGRISQTRRFSTRIAPRPCGVYSRSWIPAPRFRGARHTVTLRVRDVSGLMSGPARRTFGR